MTFFFGSIWATLVAALIGAAGTILGVVLKEHFDNRKGDPISAMGAYIKYAAQINQLLNDTQAKLGASRGLIVNAHNGGGVPKPGCLVKITIVYESFSPPLLSSCMSSFQDYPVDGAYLTVLESMLHKDILFLKVSDLENGFLKDHYLATGIKAAVFTKVYADAAKILYAVFSFTQEVEVDAPEYRVIVRDFLHQGAELLGRIDKVVGK